TSPENTPASPDYSPASDTESDTSENPSSNHIPPLPAISPLLSSTDDSSYSDTPDIPPSPTHGTPFTEMTLSTQSTPVVSGALRRRVMILAPGQPIPHGRPYRYHLNGPVHMMTMRKRVGPLPTHCLAVRHSFDYSSSDHFASDDSSRDSSSSSSSETSSDPSLAGLSDSLSDHSLPAPSSALSSARADLLPLPKRIRSPESTTDLEVSSAEGFEPSRYKGTDLEMDDNVERSDGIDIDPEIQAEIDECIAYADALRVRGIDARVVVERFHDHTEEIPVHRVQAIESVQRDPGHRIIATGQQSADMLERIREPEWDNMRLRDMMDVASQRVTRSQRRELRVQREIRQIRRFRSYNGMRIARP
ncbi:hypothetical protein Tco_0915275, partial [Tanacetum coccineum]